MIFKFNYFYEPCPFFKTKINSFLNFQGCDEAVGLAAFDAGSFGR